MIPLDVSTVATIPVAPEPSGLDALPVSLIPVTLSPTLNLFASAIVMFNCVNILISNKYKLSKDEDCSSIHLTLAKPICLADAGLVFLVV